MRNIAKIEGVGISTVMRLKKEFCDELPLGGANKRSSYFTLADGSYFLISEEIIFQEH